MKILTILGSPKKNGKTAFVLNFFEEKIKEKGIAAKRINIIDYNVGGCKGCMACVQKKNEPGCVQKDDVPALFKELIRADMIVYASPLYGWDVSSQMKTFFDRHFCLVKDYKTPEHFSLLENKDIFTLTTCMGEKVGNTDLLSIFYDRFAGMLGCRSLKQFVVTQSFSPDFSERAEEVAQRMANEII
ncbi:flavodoxin family protein [Sediminispirochaeta smaragdinae]|jgi:multimeric flavodoxin WrbA|uniref:NADPH-dependent FMN reductase n=1 Tax=Sediminispirochaeta smaragdinae (strain DSM 11293 / JCM 15392 / SEBR 4228) TaxID=573413 RepID=E1R6V1_SEDSS|nr:flavodoxin family protein [Sediminispirochaeta smaragdinae]ADK79233.1 NADPH-dependent FMN reductase [Sediminispirochaeta smaragdinae DSM 11293]